MNQTDSETAAVPKQTLARVDRADAASPGLRVSFARLVARIAPPFVAPLLTQYLCPNRLDKTDSDRRVYITSITGSRVAWRYSDIHAHDFLTNRYYDWRLLAVATAVIDGPVTVLDVGANIGTETIPLADLVGDSGTVHAFEPVPDNLADLRYAIGASRRQNIVVHTVALSDRRGSMSFCVPANRHMTGIGYLTDQAVDGAITVDVSTLDHEFGGQAGIAFIAIDVEGFEISVLRGARAVIAANRPVIVLEASGLLARRAHSSLVELHQELVDQGYEVRAIRRFGLKPVHIRNDAEPCNWVAVPQERDAELRKIDKAIFRAGALPPWRGLNPLATRKNFAGASQT